MRTFLAVVLLFTMAGVVHSGPEADAPAKSDWKVEPLKVPSRDGAQLDVAYVIANGDHALLVVEDGDWSQSVWRSDGAKLTQVKYADGKPLSASYIYDLFDGETVVLNVSDFDTDTRTLVRVDGVTAKTIVDPKGKPVSDHFYITQDAGVILAQLHESETDKEEPLFRLMDNVMQPVVDAKGKQMLAFLSSVEEHPDGRKLLRRAIRVAGTYEEHAPLLLQGAKAVPIDDVKIPEDWEETTVEYLPLFLKDRALVIAMTFDYCRVWVATSDKAEWVTGPDGEPLKHDYLSAEHHKGTTYLLAGDETNEGSLGHIYRLDGNKARRLKIPEGRKLGFPMFEGSDGLPLVFSDSGSSIPELWLIQDDEVSPLTTAEGEGANAMEAHSAWRIGGETYVTYTRPSGWYLGRLDGTVLRGTAKDGPTRIGSNGCELIDLDGDLFVLNHEHFGSHVMRYERGVLHPLKHGEGFLMEVELDVTRAGNVLYATLTDIQDERTFLKISR